MGMHQYNLELIPRSGASDPESEDRWGEIQPPGALLAELRSLLPKCTSWGDVEEFASEADWGSDLRIWHTGQHDSPVFSIEFRFVPTVDDEALLERFLALAASYGLAVWSRESARALEPKIDVVLSDLQSAAALRLRSDP